MEPVHYKSGGEAVLDLVASRADINVGNLPAVQSFLADGRIRVLAVLGDERLAALPDVPTMAELGYENAEVYSWTAVFAPAGTPEAVVEQINADIGTVLEGATFRDFMTTSQMFAAPEATADFAAFVAREMDFWATIAREREITE
jgi:tripartite-type tricarboxylate transporter receptor subunit TctC